MTGVFLIFPEDSEGRTRDFQEGWACGKNLEDNRELTAERPKVFTLGEEASGKRTVSHPGLVGL